MAEIHIEGARTHNLKNVSLTLPQNKLIVIAGPSGSGKSSLAFDTLYAEGQRRYLEGVSAYAKQFLGLMERPDVDLMEGLTPSIAVGQQRSDGSPRSTVGTATEVNDYLKLLFARAGTPCCPTHGKALRATPVSVMAEETLAWPEETPVLVIAPVSHTMASGFAEFFQKMGAQGFQRFRIDGAILTADEIDPAALEKSAPHSVEVVVDRLKLRPSSRERLSESLELAAGMAGGRACVAQHRGGAELHFSTGFSCDECGFTFPEIQPSLFTPITPPKGEGETEDDTPAVPRYRMEAHHILLGGEGGPSYPELLGWNAEKLADFFAHLKLEGAAALIAAPLLSEIRSRIGFLIDADIGYLSLSRSLGTLSRGEAQRIRLAAQLSSRLAGITYVLDEPASGMHASECEKLVASLRRLRDQGNTVVAVEHSEQLMRAADCLVDMGPGAGESGGEVMAAGTPEELMAGGASLTGAYLSGRKAIPVPKKRRDPRGWIRIGGAREKNLKGFEAAFPEGCVTAVTGVSGSGKSALACGLLYEAAARALNGKEAARPLAYDRVEGLEHFDKAILVDQSPIGRTPRSTPSTYLGLFQLVREAFAETLLARERGYGAGRFSFNAKGGRCEACQGDGIRRIRMQFLPDIYVPCDVCRGTRYNRETLEVRFKGLNIAEVLDLSAREALEVFSNRPAIARKLQALIDVGLGYVRLGQSSHTLSGGECQRIKIAAELAKPGTGKTLYVMDEPTAGLHFKDTEILLSIFKKLCDAGNTIVLVEQDLSVIAAADWVIDLGGRGPEGGRLIAAGTPEEIAAHEESLTGQFLKKKLA